MCAAAALHGVVAVVLLFLLERQAGVRRGVFPRRLPDRSAIWRFDVQPRGSMLAFPACIIYGAEENRS